MTNKPSRFESRRVVLATGAISIASIAGCSAVTSSSPELDLTLFNQTDSPYTVELSLLRVGHDQSRSEARAYSASIDIEPQGETQRTGVARSRQYVVQYDLFRNNSRQTEGNHVHFYPTGYDSLAFDIRSPGMMIQR